MENTDVNKNEDNYVFPGYEDAGSYSQDALRSILMATKASNDLPAAGDEFDYYSTFQGFRALMLKEGKSILSLMTSLMQTQGIREKFEGRELEDKFDLLIDVNDTIFENASNYLDEAAGLKKSEEDLLVATKRTSTINTSWNRKFNITGGTPPKYTLLCAKNITRPQLSFKEKVDNTNTLFVPILKEKPNSIKPLAIILERDNDKEEFCHPYECEIDKFIPGDEHLEYSEPIVPKPIEETPLVFVKSKDELIALCEELKKEKEFAVDLEHHSYRSFQGFTCLMQISTREKDYIVDVLDLRSEMYILNEVFTDPNIVKILHGADMDVLWLQRDFGIYIVNLFDTGQAARVQHFAHLSLSYLLKHYCKLDLDKKFQLADWRIRPLPAEMLKYAREDTHYLLYVYDCLKNDLLKDGNEMKNLLHSTFERSKMICLKKYEKPLFDEEKYLELYKKSKKILNPRQLYCLKGLYAWRDKISREYDESTGYVLPNHMLLQIAETLPKEQQGILACCNPIPPFVRQQLNELHSIIYKANELSVKQLEAPEFQQKAEVHVNNQLDLNNMLHCPHDIHHIEQKDHLPNSTNASKDYHSKTKHKSISLLKIKPLLTAFQGTSSQKQKHLTSTLDTNPFNKVADIIKKLTSPYQRYTITKQYAKEQASKIKVEDKVQEAKSTTNLIPTHDKYTELDKSVEIIDVVPAPSSSRMNMSSENTSNITRKKKKQKAENPDISLRVTPKQVENPPRKKACSPEVIEIEDDFQPYDYSQSDLSSFTRKGKQQGKFEQGRNRQSEFQGRPWKKRKNQGRQSTFSSNSSSWTNPSNRNWPQNK